MSNSHRRRIASFIFAIPLALMIPAPILAQESPPDTGVQSAVEEDAPISVTAPRIAGEEVLYGPLNRPLENHPGAATIVSSDDIKERHALSTQEALHRVPGVHTFSEDGGRDLRPNIGIRGVGTSRSGNGVIILADGAPIQPSLYGDKGNYYSPPISLVDHIEVIRGANSVAYGPGTIGGVVNYITKAPPAEQEIRLTETVREGGFYNTDFSYGNSWDGYGILFGYLNQTGRTKRDNTATEINDANLRVAIPTPNDGNLALRFNFYREIAQTPGGITPAQFQADPDQSQRTYDWFLQRRVSVDANYRQPIDDNESLEMLLYTNWNERNWFIANAADATATTNGQNLRDHYVLGLEPRYRWGNWLLGLKGHYEQQQSQVRTGTSKAARSGPTTSEADLSTLAGAAYLTADFNPIERLTLTPGIRYEWLEQQRNIGLPAAAKRYGRLITSEIVGGLGGLYELNDDMNIYGGVHRTFEPPSWSEAISATTGAVSDLDAEIGVNYEIGVRGQVNDWLNADLGYFFIDFENKITAGTGGALQNAGASKHEGVEAALTLGPWGDWSADATATWLNTEQLTGTNIGKDLAMVPEWTFGWGGEYRHAFSENRSLLARLEGLYVGDQYADAANTEQENAAGTVGKLPSRMVWNARAEYSLNDWNLFGGVNNLFDEHYIESRNATFSGIIPGLTRNWYAGLGTKF